MQWIRRQQARREVPIAECQEEAGRSPFIFKWVDKLKAGGSIRRRRVVRDIKKSKRKDEALGPGDLLRDATHRYGEVAHLQVFG